MEKAELYLVFGGHVTDPRTNILSNPAEAEHVGMFADYNQALDAWRAKSQEHVDDAYMRYFVAPLHELLHPDEKLNADIP